MGVVRIFPGREKLYTILRVEEWVRRLVEELVENLTEDQQLVSYVEIVYVYSMVILRDLLLVVDDFIMFNTFRPYKY